MSSSGNRTLDPLYLRVPEVEGEGAAELEGEEEEDDTYRVHLIPRSSPTPKKKSAGCEEQEEPSANRKVFFADTCGLDLVQMKYFQDFPELESPESAEGDGRGQGAKFPFYVFPSFILPASLAQLMDAVRQHKVEVESIQPIDGDPLSIQGVLRVLNLSFQKSVYVRATLDNWSSYYDHPADYIPGSSDGTTDQFGFQLSFVGSYASDGARLEFVVRYETPAGTYWANNGGSNYSVVCKLKEEAAPTPKAFAGGEVGPKELRSCLKPRTWRFRERNEDAEKAEWDRQDRTEDTDTSSFSDGSVEQVPKVQVMNSLTQAHPEGISSGLPDQPQAALENHAQRNQFIPIEEAQEAGTDQRVTRQEAESCYQGLRSDAFQQEGPVNTASPGSQVEKEDEYRDSLEVQGEIEGPLSLQGSRAQRGIEAKVLRLAEETSLPIESHLDKAGEPSLQAKGIPEREANSRALQKPEPIGDENSAQGTGWQEVNSQAAGSEPWPGNLNPALREIGTVDWEGAPVQQAPWEGEGAPVQQAPWEGEGAPVQQAPWEGEGAPVQQAPWEGEGAPVQQAPWEGEGAPVQQAPWEGEGAPVQQAPWEGEGAPVQQAPWEGEGAPVQQAPWEGEGAPVQQAPWEGEGVPVQQAPAPVEVAAGGSRSEGSARLYLAVSLHAVGTYHEEPDRQIGHDQTPQPEAGPSWWQITPEEGQELAPVLPHGASGPQGLADLWASASDAPAPKPGLLETEESGRRGRPADGVTGSCWGAREGDAPVGERGAGVDRAQGPGEAPLVPLDARWGERTQGPACTDVKETGSDVGTCVRQDDPDLQSLAVLKEVVIMASVFMQLLVFVLVAVSDSSSVLWCTMYLLSVFLL